MSKSDFAKTLMLITPPRDELVWCPNMSSDERNTGGDPRTLIVPCSPLEEGGVYLRLDRTDAISSGLSLVCCFLRVMAILASVVCVLNEDHDVLPSPAQTVWGGKLVIRMRHQAGGTPMSVSKAQPKVTRTLPQEGLSVYSSFPNSTESTAMTCNVNRLLVYTCYGHTKDIQP